MKRTSVTLFTGAVAALLFAGTSARADFVQWNFNWTPGTLQLPSSQNASSFLTFTNEPTNPNNGNPLPSLTVSGDSHIVMTNIQAFSNASRANPDTFDATAPVNFKLHLVDLASGAFTDLHFFAHFTGGVSGLTIPGHVPQNSSSVDVDDATKAQHFDNVQLGNSIYNLNTVRFTPPGAPGSTNFGSLTVDVQVRPVNIQKAPEPSTMVLSCVGLSFLGLASWRKRRQRVLGLAA